MRLEGGRRPAFWKHNAVAFVPLPVRLRSLLPWPPMKTSALVAAASLSFVLVACGKAAPPPKTSVGPTDTATPSTPSTKAETKSDPALAACHATFKPASGDADVAADVDALAKGCADATKMKQMGTTHSGSASDKSGWVTFPFPAAAGKCYRVYAVAQSTAQDVDLTLVDSSGGLVALDTSDTARPILSEDGKICFKVADAATLKVRVEAGTGKFALQVWSD